jgi:hypothetical protein
MTDVVARLRQLEAAATPGPWSVRPYWFEVDGEPAHSEVIIGEDRYSDGRVLPRRLREEMDNDNAALIVAARNALPQLLDIAEAMRRLAGSEGFVGVGMIGGDSFPERELRARMQFARDALAALDQEAT